MKRNGRSGWKRIRQKLFEKRAELLAGIGNPDLETRSQPIEDGEHAAMLHDDYVSISVSNIAFRQLAQIDLALDRVQTGEYGICAACDERISEKRLQLIPWAAYCVRCQDQATAPDYLRGGL